MSRSREKFATQVNSKILATVRTIAAQEGRQLQALVDEAFADLIEKCKNAKPRPQVMATYLASQRGRRVSLGNTTRMLHFVHN